MDTFKNNITVSIACITYNQEDYIADAIESFLSQKTDFNYEIIIHDDCSTDRTPQIIREYEAKDSRIHVIYQHENQYSQGIDMLKGFVYPVCKGKYIALCEGDDYWIDEYKLQKQVDAMEQHSECYISACGARLIDARTGEGMGTLVQNVQKTTIFSLGDVIRGDGGFVATAGLMFNRLVTDVKSKTECEIRKALHYDYATQIAGAVHGGMLYLPDIMVVYRKNVKRNIAWQTAENYAPNKYIYDFLGFLNKLPRILKGRCYFQIVYMRVQYRFLLRSQVKDSRLFYVRDIILWPYILRRLIKKNKQARPQAN